MTKPEQQPVDLARIFGPLEIDGGPLKAIIVPIRSGGFLKWFDKGEERRRWSSASAFMRMMLIEQGRVTGDDGAPLEREAVEALSAANLNAIAIRLAAQLPDRLPGGDTGGGEAASELAAELTPAELLLRLLTVRSARFRASNERLLEQIRRVDVLGQLGKSTVGSAMLLAENQLRRDALTSQTLGNGIARFLQERPDVLRSAERLASLGLLEQHREIVRRLADMTSPLASLQKQVEGMIGFKPLGTALTRSTLFSDQVALAKALDLPFRSKFGAVNPWLHTGSAQAEAAIAAAVTASRMWSTGLQTAALLAAKGLAPRGAVADLFRHYDDPRDALGPTFAEILGAIHALDDDGEAVPSSWIERIWHQLQPQLAAMPPKVIFHAILALITLAVALESNNLSRDSLAQSREANRLSRMALAEAQKTNASTMLAKIADEVEGLRRDEAGRADQDGRHIRYLQAPALLRAEPHAHALVLRRVYPDQLVKVIDSRGEWARVEVFDYASEQPVGGWLSRRHLRRAPSLNRNLL